MMKAMFKAMVSTMVFLYKLTGGAVGGKMQKMPVLLLTTIGRKSGQPRTVPLTFIQDGSAYVITASNAGLPQNPAWFLNLKSRPEATIQVMKRQIQARAETASPEKKQELWVRLLEVAPGYGSYQKKTTRDIPMVILHPVDDGIKE